MIILSHSAGLRAAILFLGILCGGQVASGQPVIGDDVADFFYDPADGAMWMFTDQTQNLFTVLIDGPQPVTVDFWSTTSMIYFNDKLQWGGFPEDYAGRIGKNRLVRMATYEPGLSPDVFGDVETGILDPGAIQWRPVAFGALPDDLPIEPIAELPSPPPVVPAITEPALTFPNLERFAPGTDTHRFLTEISVNNGLTVIRPRDENTVYLYERDSLGHWNSTGQLTDPERSFLGETVHTDGSTIAINTISTGSRWPTVSLYRKNELGDWARATDIATPLSILPPFGGQLVIQGDTLAVGSSVAGEAWVYRENSVGQWDLESALRLPPAISIGNDPVGLTTLAFDESTLLVGIERLDYAGQDSGLVLVYERDAENAWSFSQTLEPADLQPNDRFGTSVTVSGNVAVVGSPGAHANRFAYVFERDAEGLWAETATLWADEGLFGDFFGSSVAMDENRLLVGAKHAGNNGAVYIYERTESGDWVWREKLETDNDRYGAEFGSKVALDGTSMIVASPTELNGRVYLFEAAIPGDANLNGIVDEEDLEVWSTNEFLPSDDFRQGDFNGDGVVDGRDFNMWLVHRRTSAPEEAVPEPAAIWLGILAVTLASRRRRLS
ncbi:MAG: hypothetical protein KDA60_02270 [Planctomycetales bacterium]|nr:hypothetical protein [Planctomycetales bacterium]